MADRIIIKNTPSEDNLDNIQANEVLNGEVLIVRESGKERAFIKNTDDEISPMHRFLDGQEFSYSGTPYEAVDLGLPSGNLWCSKNVGALDPQDGGLFFQWGDTQGYTKEQVGVDKQFASDYSDYKWFGGFDDDGYPIFTKYGVNDGLATLESEDDAVVVNVGNGWRTPTHFDFYELILFTDVYLIGIDGKEYKLLLTEETLSGSPTNEILGVKFYNKSDYSKSIFISASGFAFDSEVYGIKEGVLLHSSELYKLMSSIFGTNICYILQVIANYGIGGINVLETYYGCNVRGIKEFPSYQLVDLGLPSGNLWANKNVGAWSEEDSGLYFQWGDKQGYKDYQVGKIKIFDDYHYLYYDEDNDEYTKYTGTDEGTDGLVVLEAGDDAATMNISLGWVTPTKEDLKELLDNTNIFFISIEGEEIELTLNEDGNITLPSQYVMKGIKFYRKDDHSKYIFIPSCGGAILGNIRYDGDNLALWSSSLDENFDTESYYLFLNGRESAMDISTAYRDYGFPVRSIVRQELYEAVDLGLPSGNLWCNKNIGAYNEEHLGLYFQWGDIIGHTVKESISGYKWYDGGTFTKYTGTDGDGLTVLESADDAATQIMGSNWCMPTNEEFNELLRNTNVYFVPIVGDEIQIFPNDNGSFILPDYSKIKGLKFYNKTDNSKYIFIPRNEVNILNLSNGPYISYLWTSSLGDEYNDAAYTFQTNIEYNLCETYYDSRDNIVPIRGIQRKTSSYKTIDLGLPSGLLWADKNIGAETEEDAGLYFQWGDTEGYTAEQVGVDKEFANDWSDYKWGTNPNFTKYTSSDGLTTLEAIDDAATQIMGSDWRMPTREDFQELVSNTDIYFISTDGSEVQVTSISGGYFFFPLADTMKGVKFYNKNDHSKYIFIPASGVSLAGFVQNVGVCGYLWSSSFYTSNTQYALYLYFGASSGGGNVNFNERFGGFGVRGVKSLTV